MAEESSLAKLSIARSGAPIRRRRPLWRRWWVWLVAAVALAIAFVVWRSVTAPTPVEIGSVVAAYPSQSIAVLNATGRVSAQVRASVSSKGTGRLEWLGVVEGQRVRRGEIIARLENRDVGAQREQAAANADAARANLEQGQADLNEAEANLKRTEELARQNFISPSAVDTARARADRARAAISTLRAQIGVAEANLRASSVTYDQTLIRAPFTGVVLTKSANVGDIVTPFSAAAGTTGAVVTMADMATLEVEADVSENSIAKISVDQPAELQLDAFPDLRLLGRVSRIVPTVDRSKATLLVKVRFEEKDPRVLPDMSARVAFLSRALKPAERKPLSAVRPEAIVKRDGKEVVFVVQPSVLAAGAARAADEAARSEAAGPAASIKGTHAVLTPVTTAGRVGDLVRVDNLAVGTSVVISPPENLRDGRAVVAAKK